MENDQNSQGNENPLNDAVENITTSDASIGSSSAQEKQNQQNTAASVTATGAENADLANAVNQVPEEGGSSGAGGSDSEDGSGGAAAVEGAATQSSDSGGSESSVIDSQVAGAEPEAVASSSSGSGAQSVGGQTADGAGAPEQAESPSGQADAPAAAAPPGAGAPAGPASSDTGDSGPDTATVSESFEVNVEDELESEEDFDTETVSETFEINVEDVNDAPDISDGITATVDEDNTITITQEELLANATDVEGDDLTAVNLATNDPNATIVANDDGSFSITPSQDFHGEIIFTYDVTDGEDSTAADLNLIVNPINDAPTAEDVSYTIEEDGSLTFTDAQLLAQANDVDGDTLTVADVSYSGTQGVLADNGDGSYTFSPNENFNGDVELDFSVFDGTVTTDANIHVEVEAVNDIPVAGSTSYTVNEDEVLTFSAEQLLANSSDIEGAVTLDSVSYTGNDGILTDNGDGTFSFAPNQNFDGEVSLDVVVVDGEGATASTTAEIDVLPINDAPVQGEQAYTVNEDGSITISQDQLLAGSSDVEGDDLTASNLTVDGDATVVANDDGSFTITPDADFNGDIALQFDITDGTDTITATGDLTVNPVNDLPQPQDQAFTIAEDGTLQFTDADLLDGATDIDGDNLSVDGVSYTGTDGVLTDHGDGSYTFAPNENFNGDVQFSFGVSDGTETVDANIDVSVTPVNDVPVAGSTSYTVNEDEVLTFSAEQLLANSSDIEGEVAIDSVSYTGNDGILTDNGDGTFSFAPNQNFDGEVSLDVVVVDGEGATASTTAEIDVLPINDAPVQGDQAYTVNEDGSITLSQDQLLAGSSDIEGDDLTASNLTVDGDATVVANDDGSFTITPDADFNGDITLQFDITDGTDTITAVGDLTVNPVNDLPQPQDQAFSIAEDGTLQFTDADLLDGATDIDGDNLSVDGVSYTGTDGVLTDHGDGSYTFAPNENFNGDVQFSFGVSDGTETVEANIDVSVTPVNDVPVAGSTSYTVNEDEVLTFSAEQLLANSSDIEGEVTLDSVSYSGNDGILTDNGDGTFSFAPNQNFDGDVSLDVVVVDGEGATASTTAEIDVLPINDAPVQGDQAYTVNEDGSITLSQDQLLAGATDVEGDDLTASNLTVDGDATVVANDDGSFTITPDADFNGDIALQFDITDGTDTITAVGDLTVNPVNDLPQPQDQAFTIAEDGTLQFTDDDLLNGATDIDGDNLSIDGVSYTGTDGVLTDHGDGSYTFAPNENFNGDVQFSFGVSDGTETVDANIDVSVTPVNDVPVAGSTSYTVNEDEVLTFSAEQLLANSSDIEGEVAIDSVSYSGNDGILTDNGDGTFSFAPNQNFDGDVSLDVVVVDEAGATASATAEIDVLPINDVPVQGEQAYTVNEDGSITLSQEQLLAGSSDIEGDDLTASNLTVDGDATVVANDDGSFTITPDADFNGDIALQFDITDGTDTIAAVGDLTVNPVNDLPQPQDQAFNIAEDGTLQFTDADLLDGATDIDGDNLSVDGVSYTGTDGVLTDHGDGSYTFAPNENFNGDVQFSFGVSDGTETVDANIDVSVTPVNDVPVAGSTSYTVNEDQSITISSEQLLANSSDVEGDVSIQNVSYSGDDGTFTDNGDGTYTFSPTQDFNGQVSLDVVVVDEEGATASTTAGIEVLSVNDAPVTSGIEAEVDEDNAITITQEQLLANATDIDGDDLVATNLQTNDPDATIVANDDGSFTITHTENFNGELDFTYNVSDGESEVLTTLDLTVNPVNDAPEAGDEIFIQAEEDQTVGVTLREESVIRLDQAPEFGVVQANLDDEWVDLEVGVEIPADTEVRFVADEDAIANGTHTTQIGTFDDNASVDDWGAEIDPYTRQFSDGDLTVTVQSNDGPLGAWNGNTHIGHGIGDTDRQGLSGDEKLTVSVEGQDINEINFHLDGLGGWFMEESRHFTEVEIRAFNSDGELIDSMTYHKDDRNSYETDYTLTVDEPVSYFELGTIQGNGTYVVQNMTVSQTCPDEAVFTSIGADGTEITETVELNLHAGDSEIDLTAELPNVEVDTEGATQFASVIITEEQLLAQASDIDGDDLDIQGLELVGDNAEHATLVDNGDGTWTVTPDENFHGEIELGYQVTDGELTDSNIININFESVNDAPIVSGPIVLSTDEDQSITFTADELLANSSDVEGDQLSVSDISYNGPNGELVDNGDGSFTFVPNENFNGEVDIEYKVFDGQDAVDTHLDLTVIPVNDVPVPGEPLHTQMMENGSIIIEAKDLLSGATDVDGDILHIENLLLVDQGQGTLTDNGDNTFTFEPSSNFYGEVNLTFDISDGQASAPSTAKIDVELVNEGPDVSGPVDAVVDEDGSITITQDDLLANATDADGDNLTAINLQTNDPNASIVENADGSFTVTPSENFFGEIEFTYDVTDAIETVAADLHLTVNPVNDAPDVPDLSFTTEDGEAITITEEELLAQASDIEGDDLSVVNVTSGSDSVSVADNGDGTYTLTPQQGFFGNVDLTFDVSDGTDVVSANIDLTVEFVNDAPEAEAIAAEVDEDGSILVTQEMLLENATDQDGDDLMAVGLETNDPNATIVDNGDGTYTVTPSENFNGDIQFSYEVTDGELSTQNDLTLTVNPVNDAPEVAPANYSIEEDGSILFTQEDLLNGAVDIDGDNLTVTDVSYQGDEGTVTDNGDGTFSFVPQEHFSGDLQLNFTVNDGTVDVEQTIDVHIEAVADAPNLNITDGEGNNVNDQAILTEPGGTVELNIAAGLVDQDLSETLTVTVDGVPEGSVIRYDNEAVLNDQQNGITSYNDTEITVTFEGETAGFQNATGYYKVDDEGNIFDVQVVYENASQVGGGGDLKPGEDSFSFNVEEGESFNLFLIPNGFNFNNFDLMQDGNFEFRAGDGSLATIDTQDPQLVFVDDDGVETVVQSEFGAIFHGGSSTNLNQDGIEHTRTTINEDGELVYGFEDLYGGGDADYTDFNFTIDIGEVNSQIYSGEVTVGADGSVVLPTTAIDQTVQLDLPQDFDEQLEVVVTATATELSNDDSESVSQTIYINATGAHIEHAPEALPVDAVVEEDGSIIITQEDLLANARDLDGDELTALNLATDDDNVTIADNGDGTWTITPDENFNGDVTFTFDVSDGDDVVSTNLELTVTPVNDLPEPEDQAFTIAEDGTLQFTDADLLDGATDIDGDNLSVDGVSYSGTDGILTDHGDGTYTFAPNENFNGDVQLSFGVSDGTETVSANIDISVTPQNDPPVAGSTSYTVNEDEVLTFSAEQLLANSSDIEGEVTLDSVSYSGTDGILTDNGDGTFSFAPNQNFDGEVSLNVVVVDGEGATVSTTAEIDVLPVNDVPVQGEQAYTVNEDGSITISQQQLLAGATDVEGDDLTASNLTVDGDATVVANDDGSFSITPDADFNGDIALQFDITDGTDTITATGDLTVNPVNDVAVAQDHLFEMDEDGLITITDAELLQGASDIDGDDLSISSVNYTGTEGVFTDNGDGTYSFAPNENFSGQVELSYGVSDGTAVTSADIGITVREVNDPPVAGSTSYSVNEDGSITISDAQLLANSSDVEGAVSVVDVSYSGDDGSFTDNGDGTYTFTPAENFNGQVSLDVTVSDEAGATAQTTAGIDVTPVNDAPVAPTLELGGEEDQVLVIDPAYILSNASDLDGDDLSLESLTVRQPQGATLQPQPDGMYHLIAPADFNGLIDLAYEISDGTETVEGSINVDIIPVNDAPFNQGNAHLTTNEDGAFTFNADDMLDLFGDIDTDNLVVSRIIMPDGEDGGDLQDNGDGTWTFTPSGDFAGTSGMQVVVSDGEYETTLDVPVYVRPVADGAVITTDHEGPLVFSEDSTGHLGLNVDLLDSSEILTNLVITGFPVGFEVSDGEHTVIITQPGQYIDVTEWDISDLALTPPEDFSGNFFITVTATTADYGDESSQAMAQPTEASGDFQTAVDETIILTADDLLEMAENASEGDVEHVHLIDRSQGDITDNGDGTWTFTPAEGFEGTVDLGYVVNDGGNLIDAQTSIGVQDSSETAPVVDAVAGTNLNHGASLKFTDADMLAQVSDLQGDELSIESMQLIDGQGLVETDQNGEHTFTPAEGFSGEATIGFVATDGEESVRSHFNINVAEEDAALTLADDGSVTFDQATVLEAIGLAADGSEVTELEHTGDDGAVIDNGDGSWTFWPDEDFSGELALSAEVSNGDETSQHDLTLQVEGHDAAEAEQPEQAQDETGGTQAENAAAPAAEASESDSDDDDDVDVDVTAAPGATTNIAIPEEVTENDAVEQVEISGLPEGATVGNALPGDDDGSFIISGDLSQPVSVTLDDSFEGTADIQFQGMDSLGNEVEDAQAEVTIEVDEQYSMQSGGGSGTTDSMFDSQDQGGDWMSGDNTDTGVDVMDDSSSYDSGDQGGSAGHDTNLDDNF